MCATGLCRIVYNCHRKNVGIRSNSCNRHHKDYAELCCHKITWNDEINDLPCNDNGCHDNWIMRLYGKNGKDRRDRNTTDFHPRHPHQHRDERPGFRRLGTADIPRGRGVEMEEYAEGGARVVGEVVNWSADECILNAEGKIDLAKLKPIIFDSSALIYRAVGDSVG